MLPPKKRVAPQSLTLAYKGAEVGEGGTNLTVEKKHMFAQVRPVDELCVSSIKTANTVKDNCGHRMSMLSAQRVRLVGFGLGI